VESRSAIRGKKDEWDTNLTRRLESAHYGESTHEWNLEESAGTYDGNNCMKNNDREFINTALEKWKRTKSEDERIRFAASLVVSLLALLGAFVQQSQGQTISVDAAPSHATNSFRPTESLGAGVDRIRSDATDKLFVESTIKQILSAGWQTVTYRQNTELHVEAWHWNPQGKWSEPGDQGYFTGNPILPSSSVIRTDTRCHTPVTLIPMATLTRA
jgi:hypothetical protein